MFAERYSQKHMVIHVEEPYPECQAVLKSLKSRINGSATSAFPYDSKFVRKLLKDVHITTIGDSLMRGIYKDLIAMLHSDELIDDIQLKTKTEYSFLGDRQIDILPLEKDRVFRQAREFQTNYHLIQYVFTTRIMKVDIEAAFLEMCSTGEFPDVLLINSCLWDITRYSRAFDLDVSPDVDKQVGIERACLEEFLERISMMIRRLRLIMPATTQVIWLNMPWPIPVDSRSLLNRADNVDIRHLSRMLIVDANFRASQLFRAAGYDVLDISFYMRNQALYTYRVKDGVHWDCVGTRIMTQLVIGHLVRSWNIPLPTRIREKLTSFAEEACSFEPNKNWAARSLMALDVSTLTESGSENGSFAEFIQRKIREGVLREIKSSNSKMYEALRSDILTMRICQLLCENPKVEQQFTLEDLWEFDQMASAFPLIAQFIGDAPDQEVTVLIDEHAVARIKNRKRCYETGLE